MPQNEPITQPRAGCLLFGMPIVLTIFIASMYALLFLLGSLPGTATGERITWTLQTCPAAQVLIDKRVIAIGLGEPVWAPKGSGWTLTATLPGRDADMDGRVPAVLTQPGRLAVYAGPDRQGSAQILGMDAVTSTSFTLREMANPLIEVRLTHDGQTTLRDHMRGHLEGELSVWLDDTLILVRGNTPALEGNLIELRDHDLDGKAVLARTAEWAIGLGNGPLPCPATLAR
jgi:hypothetical protein